MIKAAIFDFDGTLANTLPDWHTSVNLMRACLGYEPIAEKEVLGAVYNAGFIRLCLPDDFDEARMNEATEAYFAAYAEHYFDKTTAYDGIAELLAKLRALGIKLAVLSNKEHEHATEMTEALFPRAFDAVWGAVKEVPSKPDPARAFMIAENFDVKPEETALIGDAGVDMVTAKNAGMLPIGVSWGYRSAEVLQNAGAAYIAEDAEDLYRIIKSLI
jgi:HAD hydrolase, family IA, variant 1